MQSCCFYIYIIPERLLLITCPLFNKPLLNYYLSEQVGNAGVAVGIDHIDELVKGSVDNLKKDPNTAHMLETGQIKMVVGDGRLGHQAEGPYDAIHVGAAAPEIPQAVSMMCFYIINNPPLTTA